MLKYLAYFLAAILTIGIGGTVITWLVLRVPDLPAADLEAQYLGPQDHFLSLPGGVRLHYRDQGDPSRPVLVLLHGYGDSYATWEAWAERLQDRYRVISLDLPGHGLTAAPADYTLDLERYADLVARFAEALKLPPFALVGNSMGGGVAWKVAVAHPEKLRALVLVAAAGWPNNAQGQSPSLAFRILQHPLGRLALEHIDNRPLIAQGLKAQVYDKALITDAVIDRWAAYQRYPGHRRILMSASLSGRKLATPEALARIQTPTLVLHGEFDPLIPVEHSRRFVAAISGARLITYPNAGHMPQREIPDASSHDVVAFLSTLP